MKHINLDAGFFRGVSRLYRRLPVIMGAGLLTAGSPADEARLVGTWRLIETSQTLSNGQTRPNPRYGEDGRGVLVYAADHHMCAFLESKDRVFPPRPGDDVRASVPATYCGRWTMDPATNMLTHIVEVDVYSAQIGQRRVRKYEIDGDVMTLRPVPLEPGLADYYLKFRRAAP